MSDLKIKLTDEFLQTSGDTHPSFKKINFLRENTYFSSEVCQTLTKFMS